MTRRNFIKTLIEGKDVPRCGLWIGKPMQETLDIYKHDFGFDGLESIEQALGDDIRWITPHYEVSTYQHPRGLKMRPWKDLNPHGLAGGPLANADTIADLDKFEWPNPKYLNFSATIEKLQTVGDYYRLSGFWSPFFHDLTYMLGTEDLLIKMYTDPDLIKEILNRLCNFYYEANELFYQEAGNLIDGMFFGNDFGSQNDLLITPEQFTEFFLPWIKEFSTQAHRYGYHSIFHCCGSIYRIIDQLIDAGVDCIHPIQAVAKNMDAEYLSKNFKGRIAFMGGIDTQHLLPEGTPNEIISEVYRVIKLLGPNIIIGPSHEALMPNVPFHNVKAISEAIYNQREKYGTQE